MMTDKQCTLAAAGVLALAALVAAAYGYSVLGEADIPPYVQDAGEQPQAHAPPEADVLEMKELERVLPRLDQPGARVRPVRDLSMALFGGPVGEGSGDAEETVAEPPPSRPAKLHHGATLAFVGATKRFCIIDGIFYELGEELPDGLKILRIETERIQVGRNGDTSWIEVGKGN